MFIRRKKTSKRNLKPFQRSYSKDLGPVLSFWDIFLLLILIGMFSFVVYGIINTIRI